MRTGPIAVRVIPQEVARVSYGHRRHLPTLSQPGRKRPATTYYGAVCCGIQEGGYPRSPTHSESRRLACSKPAALVGRCPARPLSPESGTVAASGEQRLQERSNVLLADGLLRDRAHPHIADVFTRAGAAQHPLRGLAIGCLHGAACLPGREIQGTVGP